MQDLSEALAHAAREIARRLATRGARAWIVGGAVRDLALGREACDVDMASPATPDVVEQVFERTIPLGRSFGTLVLHLDGLDLQHTTFRTDDRYSDARRPDSVRFGKTPEEDATRRDFTCNALYLDPLSGDVLDPTGGLRDLAAGRLACVGPATRRFEEDGLRLVRMARFAGALELEPTAEVLAAARATADALRGVSRERVMLELEAMCARGGLPRAVQWLEECGLLGRALPDFAPTTAERGPWIERRISVLRALPKAPGTKLGLAGLLGPDPTPDGIDSAGSWRALDALKPSGDLRAHLSDTWDLVLAMNRDVAPARSVRLRWMRRRGFWDAIQLSLAWASVVGADRAPLERLRAERDDLGPGGIAPAPHVTVADLSARGIAPGPLYGVLLREAETLQLEGTLTDRAAALRWLEERVQEGGNSARNPNAIG